MNLKTPLSALIAATLAAAGAASAATVGDSIAVTATVVAACAIDTANDLGFGDYNPVSGNAVDASASIGVRCTNGYVSCPVCSPTRAGLITGRYQQRFGHEFNPGPAGQSAKNFGLPLAEVTLANRLKAAGYATGMVGKWHLGHAKLDYYPTRRGFDEYLGILYSNDMRPVRLIDGEKVAEYPLVQATINRVVLRFAVFVAGSLVLMAFTVREALRLVT